MVLGPPGVGKTYLCAALFELIPRAFTTYRCYTERHLLERLRQGISSGLNGDYLSHLHDLVDDELFILDDIGSSGQGQTAWREEILMEVLDHRYKHKSASVYTSNLTRVDFEMQYHLRISSRLFAAENFILDMASMPDQRALGK